MKSNLNGKTAIVTGSGRSIGKVLAIALAKEGVNIIVVARNLKEIKETSEEIKKLNVKSIYIKADLTNENEVKKMVKSSIKHFKKIDFLINNAGLITDRILSKKEREIINVPTNKFDKIMAANLKTAFLCSKEVGNAMKKQGFGKIVNISSNLAKTPAALFGPYSCAKSGLNMLTKILALELKPFNIQVKSISPKGSVKIKEREFGNNIEDKNRVSPNELVTPLIKILKK